jgi:hypothetical protein
MPDTRRIPSRGDAYRDVMKVAAMAPAFWNPFVKVNAKARMRARAVMASTGCSR